MDVNDEKPRIILNELGLSHNIPKTAEANDNFTLESYKKRLKIVIVSHNETEMEFDMIGVPAFLANTFRRVMISDVPSMAIDKVIIANNTTLLRDEVLSHRLGLIPLKADPRLFEYRLNDSEEGFENDTLEFELKIKCQSVKKKDKDSFTETVTYNDSHVYSSHLKWLPIGNQASRFKPLEVGPVQNDILINVLRPEQEIDLKMVAVKGIGRDHAKFSPVCTASYRILPDIRLTREVKGEAAERLQKCFSPGVIELKTSPIGEKVAYVANSRYDTCSRNVFRYDDLRDAVIMTRVKDHFIFSIESVGAMSPDAIFIESIRQMKQKVRSLLELFDSNES